MALRSVRAYLHNDTGLALIRVSDECPHGKWTRRPPDRIEPGETAMMRTASILLGSAESRATYCFAHDESRTLYVHWNNNSYHTNTAPGTYAFWSGPPSGHDPIVHFYVRPAGRYETDFLPHRDGFKFANHWENAPYALPPLRGTLLDQKYGNAADGLCGGMVLAALDYFVAEQEIPGSTVAPAGERDPLFLHFVNRLFDTFSVDAVTLMLKLMNPLYPDGDENLLSALDMASGRAAVMAHEEWPLIRADIDSGRPSPVCVITVKSLNPADLGQNHQVLAYAYDVDGHDVTLHVYDPNQPNQPDVDTVFMKFSDGDVSQRIVVGHNIKVGGKGGGRPVYCFIRMENGIRPVPFTTRHRLSAGERRARRVHLVRNDTVVLASGEVASGRRTYPILPDCGEAEFPFTVSAVTRRATFVITTPYYQDPAISWKINGVAVPGERDYELQVPADSDRPEEASEFAASRSPSGFVTLRISLLADRQLEIVNDPADGNYALSIQVEVQEPSDPTATSRDSTACQVVGLDLVVYGWERANAACFKAYLDRYRSEPTPVGAVADALYTQVGRPPDPLWDPDPALEWGTLVAGSDPALGQIAGWTQELMPETAEQPKEIGRIGRAAQERGGGHIELNAGGIRVSVDQGVDVNRLKEIIQVLKPPR